MSMVLPHADYDRVEVSKIQLTLKHPFFASLLYDKMRLHLTDQVPTAGVKGRDLYINPEFFNNELKTVEEGTFVLAHEIAHAMWLHFSRAALYRTMGFEGSNFNPFVWNVACDYVVNDFLVKCGVGSKPKDCLHDPHNYTWEMAVDDVYRDIINNLPPKGRTGEGSGDGDGGQGSDSGESDGDNELGEGTGPKDEYDKIGQKRPFDEHFHDQEAADEPGNDEAAWQQSVAAAAQAASQKSQGNLPAPLQRIIDRILNPEVPWQEQLRAHVSKRIGHEERTWTRLRRRDLLQRGIALPGMAGKGSGIIVWCGDTSGSMSDNEQSKGLGELQSILCDAKPEECHVLYGDAKVCTHTLMEQDSDVRDLVKNNAIQGGGGTDFRPFFDWCAENLNRRPDTLVLFTDSYGTYPQTHPGYPVIICSTVAEDQASVPDWGHIFIHVKNLGD